MSVDAAKESPLPAVTRKEQQFTYVPGVETKEPMGGMVLDGNTVLGAELVPFVEPGKPVDFDAEPGSF